MAEDLRVRKTKRALRGALLELLKEKPIGAITTTELCRRAEVNRNTFYSHYSSPFHLLQTLEDEFIAVVLEIVEESMPNEDYTTILEKVCVAMYENKELTSVIISENGNRDYTSRVVGIMHSRVMEHWGSGLTKLDRDDLELLYTYTTFGTQKCVQDWMEDGCRVAPKEFARKLSDLTQVEFAHYLPKTEI